MSQPRVLPGVSSAGQYAAALHAPSPVQLGTPSEEQLRRNTVNAIYTAGRGFGRNRYGNPDRIQEAYDASAAYVASLGALLARKRLMHEPSTWRCAKSTTRIKPASMTKSAAHASSAPPGRRTGSSNTATRPRIKQCAKRAKEHYDH